MKEFQRFLQEEDGMGVVEVIFNCSCFNQSGGIV